MHIEFSGISKSYGSASVLKGINLEIESGSCFALLGPNGSGKTTLLKSLLGFVLPDAGTIQIDGASYPAAMPDFLNRAGYMPQQPLFPENLRIPELIDLFRNISAVPAVRFEKIFAELGISAFSNKRFHELSQGMKQKINLLQCFMFDRDCYILDEPTASLDPVNAYYLKNKILEFKKENKTILFTSHIMKEVEQVADKVCLILDGQLSFCMDVALICQSGEDLEAALIRIWKETLAHA
jgi:Cu-processing system ATP-binding protein